MHKVSGYMMVLNEEICIEGAIRNIAPRVDDFLIMDSGSTDGTMDIISDMMDEFPHIRLVIWKQTCRRLGVGATGAGWNEPGRRNFCLKACKHEWVFTMDADELIDCPVNYFREVCVNTMFPRYNMSSEHQHVYMWNQAIWYPDAQVRFFNKYNVLYTDIPLHCVPAFNNGAGKSLYHTVHSSEFHLWHYHAYARRDIDWTTLPEKARIKAVFWPIKRKIPGDRQYYKGVPGRGFE